MRDHGYNVATKHQNRDGAAASEDSGDQQEKPVGGERLGVRYWSEWGGCSSK